MKKDALFHKNRSLAGIMISITVSMLVVLFLLTGICGILADLRGWLEEKKIDAFSDIVFFNYAVGKEELLHYLDETKKYYETIAEKYPDDEPAPGATWLRDEGYENINYKMGRMCLVKDTLSISLIFYDEERDRVIYVFDVGPTDQKNFEPGQWVSATIENLPNNEEMLKISDSLYEADYRHSSVYGWTITEYIPLIDDDQSPAGFFVYDIKMDEIFYRIAMYLIFNVLFAALLIMISGVVFMMVVRRRVVKPLADIADAANDFSELDSQALMDGERVFSKLEMKKKTPKEIMILRDTMHRLEDSVGASLVKINTMTKERERIRAEFSFAAQIQRSMLPELDGVITSDDRFSLYATMRPAKSVGGDFYDFFMLDEDRLAFLVADVSGKGLGAALFMAVSKSVISTRIRSGGTPAEVLRDADAILSEGNDECMFVTVFLAILNLKTGEVTACNAGHNYPYVCIRNEAGEGDYRMLQQEHGAPLAFFAGIDMPHVEHPLISWQLSPGDRVFLYTDGVNEAQGSDDIQFGTDRVKDVLDRHRTDDDKTVCDSMLKEVDMFLKNEPQFDDITLVSLTYN